MRDYLDERNLVKAASIAVVATVMVIPRIFIAGVEPAVYIPAALMSMTLVAGAATAWGRQGGLRGLFPGHRRAAAGMGAAALLALCMLPAARSLDSLRLSLIESGKLAHWIAMPPPTKPFEVFALILWNAGFETLFFQAGVICYLTRLFQDWRPALAGSVGLRAIVAYAQMGYNLSDDYALWFQAGIMADTALAGGLYVVAGWPAAAVYALVMGLRHLL